MDPTAQRDEGFQIAAHDHPPSFQVPLAVTEDQEVSGSGDGAGSNPPWWVSPTPPGLTASPVLSHVSWVGLGVSYHKRVRDKPVHPKKQVQCKHTEGRG